MRNILLIIIFIFTFQIVKAQIFYKDDFNLLENDSLKKTLLANSQYPILINDLDDINNVRTNKINKFTSCNLLCKENKDIKLSPIFNLSNIYELKTKNNFSTTQIGGKIEVNLWKKIYFKGTYNYSSLKSVDSINIFNKEYFSKYDIGYFQNNLSNLSGNNLDFRLVYLPNKNLLFEIGYDKNFIGNGIRSLFLSNNHVQYPFAKINLLYKKFQYSFMIANFKHYDIDTNWNLNKKNKFGVFHTANFKLWERLNISIFETVVWQDEDTLTKRGFDVNYLNPFVFFRPVESSLSSPDNALMGINANIKIFNNTLLYSQILLDEFNLSHIRKKDGWWANKYAIQAGMNILNIFKIKNLDLKGEVNYVRPFTYSHQSPQQNYAHATQSLAHPYGANFYEIIGNLNYLTRKWFFNFTANYAEIGLDEPNKNYGQNIFKPYLTYTQEYNNTTTQGIKYKLIKTGIYTHYFLDLTSKINIYGGIEVVKLNSIYRYFVQFGIKTGFPAHIIY